LPGGSLLGATTYQGHVFDATVTEFFFRIAWELDASGIAGYPYVQFVDENGSPQLTLRFNGPTQSFRLYRGGIDYNTPGNNVLLASGNIVLRAGILYLLEGTAIIDDASGTFLLKINAVTDISYSGDTKATATAGVRSLMFLGPWGGGNLYIDDIAFNDTSGSFENSYPGLGGIFFLKANGAGATQEWTPSALLAHHTLVDDVPANTTDWVQGENAGDLELFDIEDTPDYVTAINVVQPAFQAAVAVSGSNEIRDVVSDGTEYSGDTTHTVISIAPSYVLYLGKTYYEQPDGVSGAFDATALDALQMGFEIPA